MQARFAALFRRAAGARCAPTKDELRECTSRLPLVAQPGSAFSYGISIDVLGALVEQVMGTPLRDVLKREILQPLGMVDTDFFVPRARAHRLVSVYSRVDPAAASEGRSDFSAAKDRILGRGQPDDVWLRRMPAGAQFRLQQAAESSALVSDQPPDMCSAGGGLVSTQADLLRFMLMLLRGGIGPNGTRVLGRPTVDLMLQNHLERDVHCTFLSAVQCGFGLGGNVVLDPAAYGCARSSGSFSWGGAGSLWFVVDPKHDLGILMLSSVMPSDPMLRRQVESIVYGAIVD
eukprot:451770-Prymnesium_polylepis.1